MKPEDLCVAATGFLIAAAMLAAVPSHAATVMHVMVYNVQEPSPTEHTVFAMPSAEACEASLVDWDKLSNDAGDRSEARCIEVTEGEL